MLTIRTILILVAVLVADSALAQSHTRVTANTTKTSDHKKTTATDKRGTENSPLIIKVLPSKEVESAAEEEREEKTAKRKTDQDLATLLVIWPPILWFWSVSVLRSA